MTHTKPEAHHRPLLDRMLRQSLPAIDDATRTLLLDRLEWIELDAGQVLMREGDPGDAMYLCLSGRLRVTQRDASGGVRTLRRLGRGALVGELSLYTAEPRSATVTAQRHCVLVRLGRPAFDDLVGRSAALSVAFTRQIIERMRGGERSAAPERPVTVGLLPVSAGVDGPAFAADLARAMARHGRVCVADAAAVGAAASAAGDAGAEREVSLAIARLESEHDVVLLLADDRPSPWTRRVCRHSDEILCLADADQPPALHPSERACLAAGGPEELPAQQLLLLHPADRRVPRGAAGWLARRPVDGHLHVRPALARDMARLARLQCREGVGLVLAGGGARGFAHLGVMRALEEQGIEVDCVGGTSIGAVMALCAAVDQPLGEVIEHVRRAFRLNPTGDFNPLPMLSLIRGRRLRRVIEDGLRALVGDDARIEDLWKPYFAIASDYSHSRQTVLRAGSLATALRASTAIPGALPPVLDDGRLLCDGGTFNNFPVDVMRAQRGIRHVIGVDLNGRPPRRIDLDELPGSWALLLDRLRGRRRYRLPSLTAYLMNVTILVSLSRSAEGKALCDLYFNPPLLRVGMLSWHRFDSILRQGHEHASQVLRDGAAAAWAERVGTAAPTGAAPGRPTATGAPPPASAHGAAMASAVSGLRSAADDGR